MVKDKNDENLRAVAGILKEGKVVCLTGAGISYESGIPTFRGKGGLWEEYDPEVYANMPGLVSVLRGDPGKFVKFLSDFYSVLLEAKPNPGHLSLCYLEKNGLLDAVVTQNIDNLHQSSGTRSVVELHGNAFRVYCQGCGAKISLEKERVREMMSLLERAPKSRRGLLSIFSRYCPRCAGCGGRYRIDIVLFGENLPEEALDRSWELLNSCKTLLVVGTSLVVYPAASFPVQAKRNGARIIEINPEPSAQSGIADYRIYGPAGKVLPELVKLL